MKKYFITLFIAALFVGTDFIQAQGFVGTSAQTTVAEAHRMRDDSRVVLTGHILRNIREDYYLFRDNTGEIRVEIDRRTWGTLSVTENDLVEIRGEIDRDWYRFFRRTVDVHSIRIVQ